MNDSQTVRLVLELVEWLTAFGMVIWMVRMDRIAPGSAVSRILRHRDRIWFALLVLWAPAIVAFLLFHCLSREYLGHRSAGVTENIIVICRTFIILLRGVACGLAGCWFTSPGKHMGQFKYGLTLAVTAAVKILLFIFSNTITIIGSTQIVGWPFLLEAVIVAAYFVSRMIRRKDAESLQETTPYTNAPTTEYNPVPTFLWLLVGLAPIPMFLAVLSPRSSNPNLALFSFAFCVICSLLAGLGCLQGVKNIAVRIIFGILLGACFFVLSCVVAIFQACSHMGSI